MNTPNDGDSAVPGSAWSAETIAALIRTETVRAGAGSDDDATVSLASVEPESDPMRAAVSEDSVRNHWSLDALSSFDGAAFIDRAYLALLGRLPTRDEHANTDMRLRAGDAKTWLLGHLRFSVEGRRRGVAVPGLTMRYIAQWAFRLPFVGPIAEWFGAILKLPLSLRYFRAAERASVATVEALRSELATSNAALRAATDHELRALREYEGSLSAEASHRAEELLATIGSLRRDVETRVSTVESLMGQRTREVVSTLEQHRAGLDRLDKDHATLRTFANHEVRMLHERVESMGAKASQYATELFAAIESLRRDARVAASALRGVADATTEIRKGLDAILPSVTPPTLEIVGEPFLPRALERTGIVPGQSLSELSSDAKYALFESVFYESNPVAEKQGIYGPYIDAVARSGLPFLDLGCGRGEFLRILRASGVDGVGVDINADAVARIKQDGFDVVRGDIVDFLRHDRRLYCGAAALQVVEHFTAAQLEAMLELLPARLAPEAVLILETPNPLSPFALARFHTDPTHIVPLPPERLRFAVELAGFTRTRTLFQARVPADQFTGPDLVAQFVDYAIIAFKSP